MFSFRRLALVLALGLPAAHILAAQDSSPSSTPAAPDQTQPQTQTQSQPSSSSQEQPQLSQGQLSVQARIRARREQRRAQAIKDTYGHLYEAFVGGGFVRYQPGPSLQRNNFFSWDAAVTRYFNQKLGVTVDGRGYYGTAYVGLNSASITRPAISQYAAMGGPTYRFFLRPKYSLAAHALGGAVIGNFSGDTNGFNPTALGLYADGTRYAVDGQIIGEANISPTLSLRLAGDYYATGFNSSIQNSFGFTYGFVYRFGKQ